MSKTSVDGPTGNSPSNSPRTSSQVSGREDDPNRIWEDLPKYLKIKKRTAYIRRHSDLKVTSNFRKFTLLMWKNYIVTKRRWKTSLVQFTAPILLLTILVIVVSNSESRDNPAKIYEAFRVDAKPASAFRSCKTIYLTPEVPVLEKLRQSLQKFVKRDGLTVKFLPLDTTTPVPDLCTSVEFKLPRQRKTAFPRNVEYEIRFPAVHDSGKSKSSLVSIGKEWDTAFRYPTYLVDGPREVSDVHGGHPGYYVNGFLYIQHLIAMEVMERVFIDETTKLNVSTGGEDLEDIFEKLRDKITVQLRRFPFPGHGSEEAVRIIHDTLPASIVTGFAFSSVIMVYLLVTEKEMGVRTLLNMYGIDNSFHRYAWILHNFIFQSMSALVITFILATNWTSRNTGIFIDVESHVFFVFLACYVFNLICSVNLAACFFRRSVTACISVCFIWTVTYAPYFYVKAYYKTLTFWERTTACLFLNTAISIGCHIISEVEALDEGLSWKTVFARDLREFSIGWVMIIMVLTGFAELMVAQYISRVFPDKGMVKLPWNYFLKSWYWNSQLPPDATSVQRDRADDMSFEERHPEYFEDDSLTKRRKEMSIENISKYHGVLRAAHKVNLVCYQGHVTVLLGDQGSGKSSLLKMINGTMAPSTGTIYLSRKDLHKNPQLGKAFVGYCPSQDLLFPDLTVDETLQFFTDLKGLTNRIDAYEEVERFLRITMLVDFRDTNVSDLTSSSRRMLMVATAFCGGSRVVLLDDPTFNLSAAQQRVLWDFTGQEKKHRTILVAMDLVHEVDSVVDKIVLLHYGQVTSRGSPDFLKNKFGGGYHLEVVTNSSSEPAVLENLILRRISGSRLFAVNENILDFYLPDTQTASFPGLLEELEMYLGSYGADSFTVKFVTLEELHLSKKLAYRLQRQSAALDDIPETIQRPVKKKFGSTLSNNKGERRTTLNYVPNDNYTETTGYMQCLMEFNLMLKKNINYSFRNKPLFFTGIFVPVLLLFLTHMLTRFIEINVQTTVHHLNHVDYKEPFILSDIYGATNEGVYMRKSVHRLLEEKQGAKIQHKPLPFGGSLEDVILRQYRVFGENAVPSLGIEISPVMNNFTTRFGNTSEEVRVGLTGHFNNQPLHTPAVAVALIHNILMDYMEDYIQRTVKRLQKDIKETLAVVKYEKKGYYLHVGNHPLSYQAADIIKFSELLTGPGYVFGLTVSFSYSFHVAFHIIMHIKEQDFRYLQMMAGTNKLIFWGANYLWTLLQFMLVAMMHAAIVALTGLPGFTRNDWSHLHILGEMLVFEFFYACTCVCIIGSYAVYPKSSPGVGFSRLALFFIITGPLIMLLLLPLQNDSVGITRGLFSVVNNIFMIFPSYAFGIGMFYMLTDETHQRQCSKLIEFIEKPCDDSFRVTPFNEFSHDGSTFQSCCFNSKQNHFSFTAYGVGRNTFMMFLVAAGCIGHKVFSYSKKMRELERKALLHRANKWRPVVVNEHEVRDYDVLTETAKIYRGDMSEGLIIKNLTLETPMSIKIDNMCVEVNKGECFALLGSVGAGKSTFLKLLCRYPNIIPCFGDVILHGVSLQNEYEKYIGKVSYCPDRNPFLAEMTGQEVLELIGTLRKIPIKELRDTILYLAENLSMVTEMEQTVGGYSTVTTKKLCVAMSLLGKFEVLLLDDPTRHVDPKSRKFIISRVKKLMGQGCIIMWTSHSIDQCEGVCSNMSILVNGHLRCFGSIEHLRSLYEEGFTVIVRFLLDKNMIYFTSKKSIRMENEIREADLDEEATVETGMNIQEKRKRTLSQFLHEDIEKALSELAPWEQDLCPFVAFFERTFPESILVDKQPGFLHYHVHKSQTTWSELFRKMEEAKAVVEVDSYYIAGSNLDQVFFNFTRGQINFE